jgi:long-chain acyl-CoA synthetase
MNDHPWIKSYPPGVRWDAPLPLMPVQQILDDAAARWPDHAALEFMGRKITYRELLDLCDRAAAGFQQLGVGPGVHVGLFLPNSPQYVISFFGVLKAGGTVVNYSPLDAARVLEHKIEDSRTDIMVTLDLAALYPQMRRLMGHSRLQKLVTGSLADMSGHPDGVRAHLQGAGMLAEVQADAFHVAFSALLDNDGRYQPHPLPADLHEAIAVLQYTGGTTRPAQGRDADAWQPERGLQPDHGCCQRRSAAAGRGQGEAAGGAALVPYLCLDGQYAVRPAPGG